MDPYTMYSPLHSDLVLRSAIRSAWNVTDKLKYVNSWFYLGETSKGGVQNGDCYFKGCRSYMVFKGNAILDFKGAKFQ